ncbi:DUF7919 family protein [Actinacidiphila rubida]|uniref:DUF7919 domain-containing protein n=1 Tax=Actinacidiphila rubida TaxID=310780 RepID=A0A1H8P0B8_9ACTN|nr:hypothetical protein [Actinacidiphila rubida]SEO35201.1 hypothetical protein SAMN05216267_102423 [Actinacidiphila rubida]
MFFVDLTAYEYQAEDSFTDRESGFYALWYRPAYARLNVGWLAAGRPYPPGPVPAGFVEKLDLLLGIQWMNQCLGKHECDLCPPGEGPEGNGELRIPGAPGVAYAAPSLVTHYVAAHGYRPPGAFVDAVFAVDAEEWAGKRWPDVPFPWVPSQVERLLE